MFKPSDNLQLWRAEYLDGLATVIEGWCNVTFARYDRFNHPIVKLTSGKELIVENSNLRYKK